MCYLCYVRPEDLDVKVEAGHLVISAKQESGHRTRVFEQKLSLPAGVNPETVKSSLTREGVLVVTAAKDSGVPDSSRSALSDTQTHTHVMKYF